MERLRSILLGRPVDGRGDAGDEFDAGEGSNHPNATSADGSFVAPASSLDVDALHLYYHDPACQRLYHQLIRYPAEIVPLMDLVLGRELNVLLEETRRRMEEEDDPDVELLPPIDGEGGMGPPRVQVRPYHLKRLSHMRSLDPDSIDSLLCVRGMVVRTSSVVPDLKVAHFSCAVCGDSERVTVDRGRIVEPTRCDRCGVKDGFALTHNHVEETCCG